MGMGKTMQVSEDEGGRARQSKQQERADRDNEEYCAPHHLQGRSDQFDEHVQVDVTMQAVEGSTENPLIQEHNTFEPVKNAVVRVENSE